MLLQEVRTLPTYEKFQLMEILWEDMREKANKAELSPWLRNLLRERRERVARGEAQLQDWDEVKFNLGRT